MLWQLKNSLHMTCSYQLCSTVAEQFLEPNSMYYMYSSFWFGLVWFMSS